MDSKMMIGIGVAVAAAAGIGIYLYTKKGDPNAGAMVQSDKKTPSVNAYAPPADTGGGGKTTGQKIQRDAADVAKYDAECLKQYPDRTSFGYISCMGLKGVATL